MTFEMAFRGLWIAYDVSPYRYAYRGDPGYPSEGGWCEGWQVEDIHDPEELLEALTESWQEPAWWKVKQRAARFTVLTALPRMAVLTAPDRAAICDFVDSIVRSIWDEEIRTACEEHYWDEVGGPAGEEDYFFDD